jgi:hypothetical protein
VNSTLIVMLTDHTHRTVSSQSVVNMTDVRRWVHDATCYQVAVGAVLVVGGTVTRYTAVQVRELDRQHMQGAPVVLTKFEQHELESLAYSACHLEWGSERQVDNENEFVVQAHRHMTQDQWTLFEEYAHEAITEERMEYALKLLGVTWTYTRGARPQEE